MSSGKMFTYDQLMVPSMKALVNLGGSGSIDEIYETVVVTCSPLISTPRC